MSCRYDARGAAPYDDRRGRPAPYEPYGAPARYGDRDREFEPRRDYGPGGPAMDPYAQHPHHAGGPQQQQQHMDPYAQQQHAQQGLAPQQAAQYSVPAAAAQQQPVAAQTPMVLIRQADGTLVQAQVIAQPGGGYTVLQPGQTAPAAQQPVQQQQQQQLQYSMAAPAAQYSVQPAPGQQQGSYGAVNGEQAGYAAPADASLYGAQQGQQQMAYAQQAAPSVQYAYPGASRAVCVRRRSPWTLLTDRAAQLGTA